MNNIPYVLLAILILLAILMVRVFVLKKKTKPLSTLSALAFALVVMGGAFGEDRLLGYSLMGAGVALAIFDAFRSSTPSQ
ncbi:MAG: hypothetical protein V1856_00915 [Candidatus Liptonbacteria bacterium]